MFTTGREYTLKLLEASDSTEVGEKTFYPLDKGSTWLVGLSTLCRLFSVTSSR